EEARHLRLGGQVLPCLRQPRDAEHVLHFLQHATFGHGVPSSRRETWGQISRGTTVRRRALALPFPRRPGASLRLIPREGAAAPFPDSPRTSNRERPTIHVPAQVPALHHLKFLPPGV